MFKNELALNVSQPLYPMTSTRQYNETKAYPNVVTTMADCSPKVHNWLRMLYDSRTATKWMNFCNNHTHALFSNENSITWFDSMAGECKSFNRHARDFNKVLSEAVSVYAHGEIAVTLLKT